MGFHLSDLSAVVEVLNWSRRTAVLVVICGILPFKFRFSCRSMSSSRIYLVFALISIWPVKFAPELCVESRSLCGVCVLGRGFKSLIARQF